MGRANSELVDVVYPDNEVYKAKAARVIAAPAPYVYYTFKDRIDPQEIQNTLNGFSAAARHDIKKCRWDRNK